jgi:peroxiredoxin
MSSTEQRNAANPGFEVEITSGGRAYDPAAPREAPRPVSTTRLEAKERSRRRNTTIAALSAVALVAIALWAWLSNPNANVPQDAVARVNGEFIYDRDVTREIDLTRVSYELSSRPNGELPSRAMVLEDLISRKMQLQDARKAGIRADPQEVEGAMKGIMERTGLSEAKLEETLAKYNLKLDDLRGISADIATINRYTAEYVVKDAKDTEEAQARRNEWLTSLSQTSKVDRFKAAGSGPAPRVGSEAPDFTLQSLDGKEVKLSDLRGKPVMLNFWATWCPPCRQEIPTIRDAYKEKGESNYEVLGIATQSDRATVEAFAKELGINFPVLPDADNRVTSDLYHVLPIPTSFFIDKDGIIRYMHIGVVDRPTMEKWLVR